MSDSGERMFLCTGEGDMMERICSICGKSFVPYHSKHVICSKECKRIYHNRYQQEYKEKDPETYLSKRRSKPWYQSRLKPHICDICGKPIERYRNIHQLRHDECVLKTCEEILRSGKRLDSAWRQRLYARGYTIKEFVAEVINGE